MELAYPETYYWLVARDKHGKRYIWGFYFPSLEKAVNALLPGTWVIDDEGNELAYHIRRE